MGQGLGGLNGEFISMPTQDDEGNKLGRYPNLMKSNLEGAYKPLNNEYIFNKNVDKPIE